MGISVVVAGFVFCCVPCTCLVLSEARGQKTASDSLEPELQMVAMKVQGIKSRPVEEQSVLLITEPPLQLDWINFVGKILSLWIAPFPGWDSRQ